MPWLSAVRVVSLPATASRMKNEPSSWGVSTSSSTSALRSAVVRSSPGFDRLNSASSFISCTRVMPAPMIAGIGSSPTNSASPPPRILFVASSTVRYSLRGMPIMSQMIRSGNGCAMSATKSVSPFSHMASITSSAMTATSSITFDSCLGVNRRETMPRKRAWRGSSIVMNDPKNSAASGGMSAIDVEPWPEQ